MDEWIRYCCKPNPFLAKAEINKYIYIYSIESWNLQYKIYNIKKNVQ